MNINPTEKEIGYIRECLNQYNCERVGDDCHTPLNIIEYDENGDIVGGILPHIPMGNQKYLLMKAL